MFNLSLPVDPGTHPPRAIPARLAMSKHKVFSLRTFPGAAIVVASGLAATDANLVASGADLIYTNAAVANDDVFKLPGGFTAKQWAFEVSGAMEITSAGFAETVSELVHG